LVFTGIKGAKKWVYALIIVTPLIRVASYFIFPEWRGRLSIMLHTRIDTLMVGCLLALTWEDSIVKKIMNGPWSKLLLNISLFFLLIVSPLLYQKFAGSYLMTIGYSLESVCIVWSIAWFILFPESKVGVILNSPVVMRIGVLSYSLYIWQQLFLTHNNYSYVTEFPLNVIMVYLMAEISYRFIEKPFLNFKPK
jgi:peptidoglycan/LPS O-acetylase OafA/YrhL